MYRQIKILLTTGAGAVSLLMLQMGCVSFQLTSSASLLTRERLEADIRFLADDLLEGRGTPSRGLDLAALYLANELRAAGWQPGNNGSYLQEHTLNTFSTDEVNTSIMINGNLLNPEEYSLIPISLDPEATPLKYDMVFAGHGLFIPARGADNFTGADCRGKAVINLYGAPWGATSDLWALDGPFVKNSNVAARGGAFSIYVSEELVVHEGEPPSAEAAAFHAMEGKPKNYIPELSGRHMPYTSGLAITSAVFDRILAVSTGATYDQWQERLRTESNINLSIDATMTVEIKTHPEESQASNVAAILPGVDPRLKDEWIVLMAHYDHLGYRPVAPGEDGIFNGADDNASGTAAVLEIARRLGQGKPLKRSVMVLLTCGEEWTISGSSYYTAYPLVPTEDVKVCINVDVVGRSTGGVMAITYGSEELLAQVKKIGVLRDLTIDPGQPPPSTLVYRTDSYHFVRSGIPTVNFITDFHEDYHEPSDEAEKIHYQELSQILEVISDLTDFYCQGGEAPGFKRLEWFIPQPQ